jgi:hypothetical protein
MMMLWEEGYKMICITGQTNEQDGIRNKRGKKQRQYLY